MTPPALPTAPQSVPQPAPGGTALHPLTARERVAAQLPPLGNPLTESDGHPLLFVTVSGAHLYGFPSRDSDVDLRGVHLLPVDDLVGLRAPEETHSRMWVRDEVEWDLVTHDLRKFVRMLLRRNGYVLEQLLSPLVVGSSPTHAELVALSPKVLTRHHAHHYRGFARTQWRLWEKTGELKPLLYTFRVLLTGVHLMRSHQVLAHLPTLVEEVPEAPREELLHLVAVKEEAEKGPAVGLDPERALRQVEALHQVLDDAERDSTLPQLPSGHEELHELLVRVRS
ncbi:nucleotidyltransferase domain-containing protein [Streptomyces sp. NPDC005438]|uniref:nucleotidyltransferase domain-containing protein n=1 Tax=Streptomyces sp. NPDC005438 TaxID=3156880 RepID=UPI0033A33DAF